MSSTRVTQAPDVKDAFNTTGNVAIGGRPATSEFYDQLTRQASGIPPKDAREVAPQPAAPSGPVLPYLNVARAAVGKEIQRLRAQAEAGRRDLQGKYVFTASGQQ